MAAIQDFLKKNTKFAYGGLGAPFALLDAKAILDSDHKFTALAKTVKDFVLVRAGLVGVFAAATGAIRSMVAQTGSLDAALKRLGEVQRFQRLFAPLVGGAQAARQHVAGLLNFAANTPFRFESIADADHSLRGLSKGAFAGTGALKIVGDAAAASGNGIESSAKAVGEFYQTLSNGEPIAGSVDQLRQMGLVSDVAARNLERLSESGSSSADMATNLTGALRESSGGMASFAKDLEAVGVAREKAGESAQAAFGASFTDTQVEETKNYTAALVAVTPALQSAGGVLASLSNGLSTTKSWFAKVGAESGTFGAAIKIATAAVGAGIIAITAYGLTAIPSLIAAIGAATTGLIAWAGASGIAATAITVLGGALGVLAAATGVIALVALTAGIYNLVKSSNAAENAIREENKAHREAQAAINAHAAGIETLTDLHEAYGKSIEHIIDLQKELAKAENEGDDKKIQERLRALNVAKRELNSLPAGAQLASPERGAVIQERMERRRRTEEARFQEATEAEPGQAGALHRQRAEVLEQRAGQGRAGLEARMRVAEQQEPSRQRRQTLEAELVRPEATKAEQDKTREQIAIIDAELNKIAAKYGGETAVGLEARARRIQAAKSAEEFTAVGKPEEAKAQRLIAAGEQGGPGAGQRIQELRARATEQAKFESEAPELAMQAREHRGVAIEAERGQTVETLQTQAELGAHAARRAGRTQESERQQDIGAFLGDFEQLRKQFSEPKAREMAIEKRKDELLERTQRTPPVVADSLTRIGGGGGFAGVKAEDPMKRVQERIRDLNQSSLVELQKIAAAVTKSGTPEPGGGEATSESITPPVQSVTEKVPTEAASVAVESEPVKSQPLPPGTGGKALASPGGREKSSEMKAAIGSELSPEQKIQRLKEGKPSPEAASKIHSLLHFRSEEKGRVAASAKIVVPGGAPTIPPAISITKPSAIPRALEEKSTQAGGRLDRSLDELQAKSTALGAPRTPPAEVTAPPIRLPEGVPMASFGAGAQKLQSAAQQQTPEDGILAGPNFHALQVLRTLKDIHERHVESNGHLDTIAGKEAGVQ